MPIHLYAEHLVNIRTLSLQASLSTVSNKETRATLSADGSTLSLAHEGETAKITLPVVVPGGHNDAALTIPAAPTKDLSFRVSLSEKPGAHGLLQSSEQDPNVIPWTATALTEMTQLMCKTCHSIILGHGKVRTWKDLPSENWAEMMDFWHCHRPDVPHGHGHSAPNKGYTANSRLALESGVGMVDPVDFVLEPEDTQHLQPSALATNLLECTTCHSVLGQIHPSSSGFKLRKQHLALSTAQDSTPISYDTTKWMSCNLLSAMESQGVRKFTIQSAQSGDHCLKLWIFTPDISISSSAARDPGPTRCVKVLWQNATVSESQSGLLSRAALSEGELELPGDEMSGMREELEKSRSLLPESARSFQAWNVALLPRFSSDDVGSGNSTTTPVYLPEVPDIQNKEILSPLTS